MSRVAIVTGGAQGIGHAIAARLIAGGYAVIVADVDAKAGREAERALGPGARFVKCDVADEADAKACVSSALARNGRLDALVNNAALARPTRVPVEKLSLETWDRTLAVNLTGAFLMTKHAARHLRRARGAIVNIASTRALQSEPNTEAYSATKGGIVALTHALAASLGPRVRVNCVSPGWIDVRGRQAAGKRKAARLTREDHLQHPAGRVGTPEDVAALVAFLLADEAGFITGQNFVCDGGMTRKMIYV